MNMYRHSMNSIINAVICIIHNDAVITRVRLVPTGFFLTGTALSIHQNTLLGLVNLPPTAPLSESPIPEEMAVLYYPVHMWGFPLDEWSLARGHVGRCGYHMSSCECEQGTFNSFCSGRYMTRRG